MSSMKIYKFNQLSEIAQRHAIREERFFLYDMLYLQNYDSNCQEYKDLVEYYKADDACLNSIREHDYWFNENGDAIELETS